MKKENFKKALIYGIAFMIVMFIINLIFPSNEEEKLTFSKAILSLIIYFIGGCLIGILEEYIKIRRVRSKLK
ncbi:MAG: hypothetical protein ACEPOV_04990 [Hyphomicrobiales bacterium]